MLNKRAAETRNLAVDFTSKLAATELITGTPTVIEVGSSELTIANIGHTSTAVIGGSYWAGPWWLAANVWFRDQIAHESVTFSVAGGVAGKTYKLRITATTNATSPQTLIQEIQLRVN